MEGTHRVTMLPDDQADEIARTLITNLSKRLGAEVTSQVVTAAAAIITGTPALRKEQALCCIAKRDRHGRLPIGFCGPTCSRRPRKEGI